MIKFNRKIRQDLLSENKFSTYRLYAISETVFVMIGLFFLVLLVGCKDEQYVQAAAPKPNILLILADDLGFTDLGCYGGEILTPNLDKLASIGIRNTAFYVAPTCSPTRAMLLSGVDTHRNGYGTMEGDWAQNQIGLRGYEGYLNFDVVAFPKLLQDHGYHTSMAGKWHQAFPASEKELWPDKRGFDRSFTLLQGGAGHFSDQQKLFSFFERTLYQEDGQIVDTLNKSFYSTDYYTKKAIAYIDESQALQKPFFSYLAFTAPHWPLQVPDAYIDLYKGRYDQGYEILAAERLKKAKQLGIIDKKVSLPELTPNIIPWNQLTPAEQKKSSRTMEVYAAMIERLDANVGKLIDHLKAIGQFENTLIVFMSDNGAEGNSLWGIADTKEWVEKTFDNSLENIGRKNSYTFTGPSWAQVSTLPFKWYKSFASEGGVRAPSIISYPQWKNNFGKINNNFISVMDMAPTFLEMAGVEHPENEYQGREVYSMDGNSMRAWLEGNTPNVHSFEAVHCWELYGRRAVLKGNWKAVWEEAPYGIDAWQLYNLASDPSELYDLSKVRPDTLEKLILEWDAYAIKYKVMLPNENVAYGFDEVWKVN